MQRRGDGLDPRSPPAAPGQRVARDPDQHADTKQPEAPELALINVQMNPTAAAKAGAPDVQWDGDSALADHATKRQLLKQELTVALTKHLKEAMSTLKTGPALAIDAFEGAGRAAKRVVDLVFGSYATAAVLTAPLVHKRANFKFEVGRDLIDRTKPSQYTPQPEDLASWMAQTDKDAAAAQKAHGFNKDRSDDERAWLNGEVLQPFVDANRADLEQYDIYDFGMTSDGVVSIAPLLSVSTQFPDVKPVRGWFSYFGVGESYGLSPAERRTRWNMWQTLVHEYIHTLEHPAFKAARRSNRIFSEGFCEMFTEEVLQVNIPLARSGDATLRTEIEGTDDTGKLLPDFKPQYVHSYNAGSYADYAKRAKNIRAILGTGGENAVRAAFFQGHIELIGLSSTGKIASPPTRQPPKGKRFHTVVGTGGAVETPAQIATQNGISILDLQSANSGVDLGALAPGDVLTIPIPAI